MSVAALSLFCKVVYGLLAPALAVLLTSAKPLGLGCACSVYAFVTSDGVEHVHIYWPPIFGSLFMSFISFPTSPFLLHSLRSSFYILNAGLLSFLHIQSFRFIVFVVVFLQCLGFWGGVGGAGADPVHTGQSLHH